jgi:hypothetical protein
MELENIKIKQQQDQECETDSSSDDQESALVKNKSILQNTRFFENSPDFLESYETFSPERDVNELGNLDKIKEDILSLQKRLNGISDISVFKDEVERFKIIVNQLEEENKKMRENYTSLKSRIDSVEKLISNFNLNLMNSPKRNVVLKKIFNEGMPRTSSDIQNENHIFVKKSENDVSNKGGYAEAFELIEPPSRNSRMVAHSRPISESGTMLMEQTENENVTSLPPLLGTSSSLSSLSSTFSSPTSLQVVKPQYYHPSSLSSSSVSSIPNHIVEPLPTSLITPPSHSFVDYDNIDRTLNFKGDGGAAVNDNFRDKERRKPNEVNETQRVVVSKIGNMFEKEKRQARGYRKGNNEYDYDNNDKSGEGRSRYFGDDKNKKAVVDEVAYNGKSNSYINLEDGGYSNNGGDVERKRRGEGNAYDKVQQLPVKKRTATDRDSNDYNEVVAPKRKVGYDDESETRLNRDVKFLLIPPCTVVIGDMIRFMYDDKFHTVLMRQKIVQVFFFFLGFFFFFFFCFLENIIIF